MLVLMLFLMLVLTLVLALVQTLVKWVGMEMARRMNEKRNDWYRACVYQMRDSIVLHYIGIPFARVEKLHNVERKVNITGRYGSK